MWEHSLAEWHLPRRQEMRHYRMGLWRWWRSKAWVIQFLSWDWRTGTCWKSQSVLRSQGRTSQNYSAHKVKALATILVKSRPWQPMSRETPVGEPFFNVRVNQDHCYTRQHNLTCRIFLPCGDGILFKCIDDWMQVGFIKRFVYVLLGPQHSRLFPEF